MKTYKERTQSILAKAEAVRKQKRKRITFITVLSSVAAVILALNLVLFVPYTVDDTDLTKYSSSEYYDVIKQLYGLTHETSAPRRTNNYTEWFGGKSDAGTGVTTSGNLASRPPSASVDGNGSDGEFNYIYNKPMRHQTDGVTEGDFFKLSDTHVFYLGVTPEEYEVIEHISDYQEVIRITQYSYFTLRVYTIAGENSEPIAEYKIEREEGTLFYPNGSNGRAGGEMILSEDFKTITVLAPSLHWNDSAKMYVDYTAVINIDVSDLSDIKETNRTYISGDYTGSRSDDGDMLVITQFYVPKDVDFGKPELYVPHVGKLGQMKPLLAKDIICPSTAYFAFYTVISSLNAEHEIIDSVALMSFSDEVCISQNNIFTTQSVYAKTTDTYTEDGLRYVYSMSEICIVPYSNGVFGDAKTITVAGTVLSQYGLDEYNGMLRVVTTVSYTDEKSYSLMKKYGYSYNKSFDKMCMLYCYDLNTLELIAKVTDFAPENESAMSARFDGDTAYVCTATTRINITDPVFVFDLSNLNNITYTVSEDVSGYSLSLYSFAYDTLLSIGYGDSKATEKIELYKQNENAVELVAKYEEQAGFSSEYKAHLIDAKNGIIGLGITSFIQKNTRYAIFRYDGNELTEIASVKMQSDEINYMRAAVIDGYVYILDTDGTTAKTVLHVIKIA
ncbi:MAG: beta-propeller domain-containing protein [Clostridiales bacterium]|nr:beta-propeller domain-containing protein [Clostridiales bacterium]